MRMLQPHPASASRETIPHAGLFQRPVKRGMIRVDAMPKSPLRTTWLDHQSQLSRSHSDLFEKVTIAIYVNEYAFCWKQDSALQTLLG